MSYDITMKYVAYLSSIKRFALVKVNIALDLDVFKGELLIDSRVLDLDRLIEKYFFYLYKIRLKRSII